jgi:hypothetical protein
MFVARVRNPGTAAVIRCRPAIISRSIDNHDRATVVVMTPPVVSSAIVSPAIVAAGMMPLFHDDSIATSEEK